VLDVELTDLEKKLIGIDEIAKKPVQSAAKNVEPISKSKALPRKNLNPVNDPNVINVAKRKPNLAQNEAINKSEHPADSKSYLRAKPSIDKGEDLYKLEHQADRKPSRLVRQ